MKNTKLQSAVVPKNYVTVYVYDKAGNLKRKFVNKNITCTAGRADMVQRLIDFNTSGTSRKGVIRYISIGTDDTAATENDTILVTETHRSALLYEETVVVSSITAKVYARFGAGYALTLKEAGLFTGDNASTILDSGELLARTVFPVEITKTTDEIIVLEWSVSLNNG